VRENIAIYSNSKLRYWCLMAISAQTGYIVPYEYETHYDGYNLTCPKGYLSEMELCRFRNLTLTLTLTLYISDK